MIDLYLRFAVEAEWTALAIEPDVALAVDVIGPLFDPPAQEGGEPVPLPGWHVNLRCADDRDLSACAPFAVTPSPPRRVWA